MSGEASELGYDEMCDYIPAWNNTDAPGNRRTKALLLFINLTPRTGGIGIHNGLIRVAYLETSK